MSSSKGKIHHVVCMYVCMYVRRCPLLSHFLSFPLPFSSLPFPSLSFPFLCLTERIYIYTSPFSAGRVGSDRMVVKVLFKLKKECLGTAADTCMVHAITGFPEHIPTVLSSACGPTFTLRYEYTTTCVADSYPCRANFRYLSARL